MTTIDQLNADTESWLTDPIAVNAHLLAQMEVARHDPYQYCELSLAYEGHTIYPHGMHTLICDAISTAREAHKHLAIIAPPGTAKSLRGIKQACVWHLAQAPKTYTSFVSYAESVCKRNLIWTRKTLISPLTRELWPHIVPDSGRSLEGGGWSTEKLYLRGGYNPAFDAHTVLSDRGGLGIDQLFFDDIVTEICKDSEPTRRQVDDRLHNTWLPRLRNNGFALALGNCWHRDDALHKLLDPQEFGDKWMVLWIGYHEYDHIYWKLHHAPTNWPHEITEGRLALWEDNPSYTKTALQAIRRSTYKRLYEQRATLVEEMRFIPAERWKVWDEATVFQQLRYGAMIYGGEDISGGLSLRKNDFAALGAVMIDNAMKMYVLDFWCARARVTDQIRALWTMHEALFNRWGQGFDRAVVEALDNNKEWFRLPMTQAQEQLRKDKHPLWDLSWGFWTPPHTKSKWNLIDSTAPFIEAGTLLFPPNLSALRKTNESWAHLVNQTEDFPPPPSSTTQHDDAPNALAIAVDEARRLGPGQPRTARDHARRMQEAKKEVVMMHPLTGKPLITPAGRKFGI